MDSTRDLNLHMHVSYWMGSRPISLDIGQVCAVFGVKQFAIFMYMYYTMHVHVHVHVCANDITRSVYMYMHSVHVHVITYM